uniref:Uncharacterized protein n=1 Tax=Moniliophthora roreri TaxID=221103 RepID=A0A0W0FJA8_MONRR
MRRKWELGMCNKSEGQTPSAQGSFLV